MRICHCTDRQVLIGSPYREHPTIRSLRVRRIDQRAQLRPRRQFWCQSALPWAADVSHIEPKFEKDGRW